MPTISTTKISRILSALVILSVGLSSAAKPATILFFDVNKTILMEDLAGGKSPQDVVDSIMAECIEANFRDWDGSGRVRSFFDFVKSRSQKLGKDKAWKNRELKKIYSHSVFSAQEKQELIAQRARILERLAEFETNGGLVDSFVSILQSDWVNNGTIQIVIRTFGEDIPKLVPRIQELGLATQTGSVHPSSQTFRIEGQEYPLSGMIAELSEAPPKTVILLQDDYEFWAEGNRHFHRGKPFPISDKVLTLFFDDNTEENIICPFDAETLKILDWQNYPHRAVSVNPFEVIFNRNFYLDLVTAQMADF